MRRLFWRFFVGVAAVSIQPPFAAQANGFSAATADHESRDASDRLFDDYGQALSEGRFKDALAAANQIKVDPSNSDGRALVDAMRASALLGLNRDKDAAKLIAESDRLAPQLPEPSHMVFDAALFTGHFDVAADALDRMIGRFPDVVRYTDHDLMWFFLRNEPNGQDERNGDRRVALARLGYGGDSEYGYQMVEDAVDILVKRGDTQSASKLLPYLKDPVAIENMLIQKRYSTLWPRIQELSGEHLQKVQAASVDAAEKAYAENPANHDDLQLYANALRRAHRFDEAIALASKLPPTSAAMADADEELGWAVNNVALAMHSAGKTDEADSLFARLDEATIKDSSWLVSMKINRLELLVGDGKFERAMTLMDDTEATATSDGTPFARQLVRRLKYCTLAKLGRASDAAKLRPEVLAHADDAPGPTIDGLLCAGDDAAAEQVTLAALKQPSFEKDFVRHLQKRPLTDDDPSIWQGRWQALRARPAIAAAFDRLGRDMPDDYMPQTHH